MSNGNPADTARGRESALRPALGFGWLLDPLRILLGNRGLTWLMIAFAGVTMAEWGYVTALAVDAFRMHGAVAVGLVGFRLFFAATSSFFCIPYVERRAGGRVMTAVAGSRVLILAASFGLAASGAPLAPLLVLVALDAVVSAPYRPAQSSLLPSLARTPKELAAATAALSTVKTLAQAIGATAGGFLLEVTTPAVVFAGAGFLFLGSGAVTLRFAHTTRPSPTSGGHVRDVVRETLAVVRHPHVAGILVVSGLRTFVRGMWIATAVIASLRLLHAGSEGVGLLMLAGGVGSLLAVPVSATLIGRARLGTPAAAALIACGIPLGLIAGIPVFDVALVLVAAWGIGMAVADMTTLSLLYRLLDTPLLPRATGAIESSKLALEGLGSLLAPVLVIAIGVRGALVVAASPLPIVVLAGWKMLHRLDVTASARSHVLALLHNVACLQPLDMAALESLVSRLVPISVPKGTEVIRQGDEGDHFYVVESGTADVLVDGFFVGEVGAGGSFGEKALLRGVGRTATVRARESMRLLALTREDFLSALTGQEESAPTALGETANPESDRWTRRGRADILSRVSLFSHLDSSALSYLAERSTLDNWPEGAALIRQGDEGDRFFVLLRGRALVMQNGQQVGDLRPGDQFGEIALLHDVPRRADVIASSPLVTLGLRREDFVAAVRSRVLLG